MRHLGLSAPQIGINERMFIIDSHYINNQRNKNYDQKYKCFINPNILKRSNDYVFEWEYCLSIPGLAN